MVGVAGKSGGCGTCRRRRVKCDEGKPTCSRCLRAKIVCAGYDRFPVFITRTEKGFVKRRPLEEVKTEPVLTLRSPDAEAVQVVSWFWESFARSPPSKYALQSPSHWLEYFLFLPAQAPALKQAVLAVSLARWSKTFNRPDVFKEGRGIYTQSLGSMQKALASGSTSTHDDVLAATCVMVLYELFDPTEGKMDGWLNHLEGVYRLLQYRGPQMHTTIASRAIFEHSRYLLMLQHLMSRRACILSQPEWLTAPWHGCEKSIEQQVFDNGLRLATAFEGCDLLKRGASDSESVINLFEECVEIYKNTVQILDTITPSVAVDLDSCSGEDFDILIVRNPAALLLSITALAIKLGACDTACSLLPVMGFQQSDLDSIPAGAEALFEDIVPTAKQIVNSVATCVDQKAGGMGAARLMFALKLARPQLPSNSQELCQCDELMDRLSGLDGQFNALGNYDRIKRGFDTAETTLVQGNSKAIARRWQEFADGSIASPVPLTRSCPFTDNASKFGTLRMTFR